MTCTKQRTANKVFAKAWQTEDLISCKSLLHCMRAGQTTIPSLRKAPAVAYKIL